MSKRGMMENDTIRECLVKPYLRSIEADPTGQFPLPKDINIPVEWHDQVQKVINTEGYKGGKWMYKSNVMGLMWPVWAYAFPDAKWVVVRRRTADVIKACKDTGYMTAFKSEENQRIVGAKNEDEGWLWWVHQYEQEWVKMITEGLNVKVVWPQRMVYGDYVQLYELLDWVGLPWKSEVLSVVDSLLENSRLKERSI